LLFYAQEFIYFDAHVICAANVQTHRQAVQFAHKQVFQAGTLVGNGQLESGMRPMSLVRNNWLPLVAEEIGKL
jgi:hypothetical protein